jgi:hypothetical protein
MSEERASFPGALAGLDVEPRSAIRRRSWVVLHTLALAIAAASACTTDIVAIGYGGGTNAGGAATGASTVAFASATVGASVVTSSTGSLQCAPVWGGSSASTTAASTTGSGVTSCVFSVGDDASHVLTAECTQEGCTCKENGVTTCTCQNAAPSDCSFGCCPAPWSDVP